MSNVDIRFYSNCLKRYVSFKMYLPYDERNDFPVEKNKYQLGRTKTLFLLHGFTGDAGNWVPEYLSDQYNFAVVIPNGENSFWLDGISSGHQFCTFLGEELLGFVRKTFQLAMNKDETYIMGLSMGGFGALHTALYYPDKFGKLAALSSALIVHEVATMKEGEGNPVANYEYYRECFGDPSKVLESDNNPETLIKKLKASGQTIPEIFMACGTEDFLIERNRELHRFLEEQNVPHVYEEDTGIHDMVFWSKAVEKFIPRMFG
ncbi:MAG: alpha/beta fold hydrolase [Lachnospiraceae bacterium]|nr:alpha/beta fold hydrolase [Lachnospiraceae bacterium]MBQ2101134.1 alpha/beta fold hydrolase [Lachnospiraceae bacterium]